MRIARSSLVTPGRNDALAIGAVAASVFVFAYSTRFGPASILLFYALWFPLAALAPAEMLRGAGAAWLPVALVALAVASVAWSAAPGTSLRASVQLATHAVCAVAAARFVSGHAMVRGLAIGAGLVLLYSLAFGRSSYDVLDGTYTFVGSFSSKNQLGLYASLCALAAALLAMTPNASGPKGLAARAVWAGLFLLAIRVLLASQSATALLALLAALAALGAAMAIVRIAPFARMVLVAFFLLSAVTLGTVAVQAGAVEMVLAAFGKDTTLTGRTYLWSEGLAAAAARPLLGVGYQAYWVQGFAEAERLWEEFYITARSGFHFHNTYIDSLVELGMAGAAVVAALFLQIIARAGRALLDPRPGPSTMLVFSLAVMLTVRSFSEVDALTPFTVGSFLMFWAAAYTRMPAFRRTRRTAAPHGDIAPVTP